MNPEGHPAAQPAKGFAYALSGVLLVSTNYVTAKYAVNGFNPATFSLVWTTAAAFFALAAVIVSGTWRELNIPPGARLSMGLMGLSTAVIMLTAWSGLKLLDPSFASFLWRFAPVFTILMSAVVLGERLRWVEVLALAVMIAAGVLSSLGRWKVVGLGVTFVLVSCLMTGVQMVTAKIGARDIHPNALAFYRVAIGATFIALWTYGTGAAEFHVAPRLWVVALIGAFLGPCASYLLTFRSYRYWDLSRTAIVRSIQPVFVLPMVYAAFHRLPVRQEMLGGSIILIGAVWLTWIHLKPAAHPAAEPHGESPA